MSNKLTFALMFVIFVIAKSEPPSTSYGTPIGAPLNSYGTPSYDGSNGHNDHNSYNDHNDHSDHEEPKSYEFGYQVKDDYSGNNYNRKETSDGNQVRGEYRVLLPDGRTQIVTYYADWQSGFHADVKYEGEVQYPDQYNNYNGGYGRGPSTDYGTPNYSSNNGYNNNQGYNNGYNGGSATSSVSIKDFSSNGTPYNGNNYNSGYNYNSNGEHANNYDSYSGNFGNKARLSNEYGAP